MSYVLLCLYFIIKTVISCYTVPVWWRRFRSGKHRYPTVTVKKHPVPLGSSSKALQHSAGAAPFSIMQHTKCFLLVLLVLAAVAAVANAYEPIADARVPSAAASAQRSLLSCRRMMRYGWQDSASDAMAGAL